MLLLILLFSTSYGKITAELLGKENEEETKTSGNTSFITWHSETDSAAKENRTDQLIPRRRRNTISGLEDLLSEKHHQDKRSVLVFSKDCLLLYVTYLGKH
ncbi:hypothetical protein AVEN_126015-1 [Araneus ventricosus]|uniref:Uncharacterized protein n=1 Tax=Araneus ventricosus TaxID=182803 RepID=A0A4Y2A8U5_ARAVE|nr:hypothetical protein AVEN_264648-1 [Araneus ventricosus]GBL77656.1 hypothetical protein AVEN_126015-1 [Araneus ventricosus]